MSILQDSRSSNSQISNLFVSREIVAQKRLTTPLLNSVTLGAQTGTINNLASETLIANTGGITTLTSQTATIEDLTATTAVIPATVVPVTIVPAGFTGTFQGYRQLTLFTLVGLITNGSGDSLANNSLLGTLPVGSRPTTVVSTLAAIISGGSVFSYTGVYVSPNGQITYKETPSASAFSDGTSLQFSVTFVPASS